MTQRNVIANKKNANTNVRFPINQRDFLPHGKKYRNCLSGRSIRSDWLAELSLANTSSWTEHESTSIETALIAASAGGYKTGERQNTVTLEVILAKFDALNVWKRGDQRAPHKPLLVLFALARWQHGETKITFEETAPALTDLLKEFGPDRKQYHPEFPFHHLQSDSVWTMSTVGNPSSRTGSNNLTRRTLLDHQATGCFTDDVLTALNHDPTLAAEIP